MCRSIKQLRRLDQSPTDEEIQAAALQFVRKVSGYRVPSRANDMAFNLAVQEISAATRRLLDGLVFGPPGGAANRLASDHIVVPGGDLVDCGGRAAREILGGR